MVLNKRKLKHLVNSIFLMFYFSMLKGEIIVQGGYIDSEQIELHGDLGDNVYLHTTDDRDPVHGYINKYTDIEITVTLTGEHHAYNNSPIITYMGVSGDGPPDVFQENMVDDDNHSSDPVYDEDTDNIPKANTLVDGNYNVTWTIRQSQIEDNDLICTTSGTGDEAVTTCLDNLYIDFKGKQNSFKKRIMQA